MKVFKTLFIALSFVFVFQSCSSGDGDTPDSGTYIRFTVNGVDYEFVNIITAESNAITLNGNNGPALTDPGDTGMGIWFPLDIEVGTFEVNSNILNGSPHKISFTSESLGFDFNFANSGTVTVTSVSGDYFEGTFSGTVTVGDNTATITNGSFRGEKF
ncbi:hypothetical protein [Tenacibaculum amylolyticum]|uniref:hypothetical protein n=1 Tax=Tenacibaculum amylolyticum TaxID=104269 RepID=UPI00389449BC